MAVMLLTEQCLHFKLHLSVSIIVPRIGSCFLKRTVLMPNFAKCKKDESFTISLLKLRTMINYYNIRLCKSKFPYNNFKRKFTNDIKNIY